MSINDISLYVLTFVSFLTWLVFVLTAAKIYKFFIEFENFKSKNDVELNSMVWGTKKIEQDMQQIITELQRINRMMYDIYKNREISKSDAAIYEMEDSLRHAKTVIEKPSQENESSEMEKQDSGTKREQV